MESFHECVWGAGQEREGKEEGEKKTGSAEKKKKRMTYFVNLCSYSKDAQLSKCVSLNSELAWVLCD
jgi:hypothetical protein